MCTMETIVGFGSHSLGSEILGSGGGRCERNFCYLHLRLRLCTWLQGLMYLGRRELEIESR